MALPLLLIPFFSPVLPLGPFLPALTTLFVCCILHHPVLELLKSSSPAAAPFLGEQPSPLLQQPLLQGILVFLLTFLPPLCYLPTPAAHYHRRLSNTQELYANVSTLHLQLHWLCFTKGVSPEQSGPKPGQHEVLSLALSGLFSLWDGRAAL